MTDETRNFDNSQDPNENTPLKRPNVTVNEITDWFESVILAVIAIITVFTFFVRVTTVQGESMLPTLEESDRLLVSDFFYTPAYNDIVVLQANGLINDNGEYGKPIVKRIIGLAGDKISIDFAQGVVYRNDVPLEITEDGGIITEDGHKLNTYTNYNEDMYSSVTVPEGCVFVMGDNRNNSLDSRSEQVGCIRTEYIIGKAFIRIMPFSQFGGIE